MDEKYIVRRISSISIVSEGFYLNAEDLTDVYERASGILVKKGLLAGLSVYGIQTLEKKILIRG